MKRWCAAIACCITAFVIAPASPVAAHASFLGSNPTDGSVLAEAPTTAELRFTEEVLVNASRVTLLRLGSGQTDQLKITASDGGSTVLATMPTLQRGAYVLRYVMVDPADLHKTVGSISFGIGVAAPPSAAGEQVVGSWMSVMLRFGADSALLLVVGTAVIATLLTRRDRHDLDRIGSQAVVAAAIVAACWLGLLLADAATVGFSQVRWGNLLIESDPGRRALIGMQLTLGTWWTIATLAKARDLASRRFVVSILGVIAAGFVGAAAYGGHAGIGGSFIVGFALRAAHLGGLGLWIGTVAALGLLCRHDRRLTTLWRSVSSLAVVGLAATGVSGLLLSGRVVATVTSLLGTTYGQRIVIKAGILVVLAILGGRAAHRVARGLAPQRIVTELAVASVAIVIAALLASAAPARGERFLPLPIDNPQIVTSDVADLIVTASIDPARPGPNLVQLRVADRRRPAPGPVVGVTVRLSTADGVVVGERAGSPIDGVIEWTDVVAPSPGKYRVEVEIDRPALPVPTFVASWQVDVAPVPRAATIVSTRNWAPIAAALAACWFVLVVLASRWRRDVRRRSDDEIASPPGP
jgi:copper transport protein